MAADVNQLVGQDATPWFLMQQAAHVPPDQKQVLADLTNPIPPALRDPNALPPQPDPQAAMKQNPVVSPLGLGQHLRRDPEQALLDAYGAQSKQALSDQGANLSMLQDYINQIAQKPSGVNWSPLAGWVDSQMPNSHLAQVAEKMAPMTEEQKDQALFEMRNKLGAGRAQMSKEQLDSLGQQLTMMRAQQRDAMTQRHYDNEDAANRIRAASYEDRIGTQKDAQAQRSADLFDKDHLIQTLQQRSQQIGIDRHTLEHSTVVPSQMMEEMATGLATALSGSKSVGLEQTKMQQLNSLQKDIAKLQSYSGTPMNALTPDQRQFLISTFDRLESAYNEAMAARSDQLRRGRNFRFNQGANEVMDNKATQYRAAAGGGKITVTNDKETYSVDPADLQQAMADGFRVVGK